MTIEEIAAKHCKNGHDPNRCQLLKDLRENVVEREDPPTCVVCGHKTEATIENVCRICVG